MLVIFSSVLTKGQSVSKYYRFLVRDGGWVWVQTKAHVVYDSKTCQPQFVFCINYVLGGKQSAMSFLSTEQTCPLPITADLKDILKGQNQVLKTEKDDIVFEERTKLLKNGSKKEMINVKQEPSSKGCQDTNDTEPSESMDCDSISFEDCFRLAWDDVIQQQDDYHKHTWDYYGIDSLPKDQIVEDTSQPSEMDESLFLPSPNTAKVTENVKEEPIEELDMHRAPFIPPPSTDAGLTCEDTDILTEISLDEPPCWLDGNGIQTSYLTPGKTGKLQSLSTVNSPVMPRKVPESVKRNGYITNDLLTTGKVCLPSIAQFDVEVNAPLYSCKLLGGNELLKALDVDMLDANT